MWVQNKQAPLSENDLFSDGASSRPLVPGTIPRGHLREDGAFFTGIENGKWVDKIPVAITEDLLKRGQDRFDIYCSPCHGRIGDGHGMIAQRGFQLKRPVGNYHTDRLRKMPVGHFYDVITNGYGAMYSYASRVEPQDRWAIVAYIKALQLSQHGSVNDLDATERQQLDQKMETKTESHEGGGH
jgi:mono/diheme cytochrome c family protein